MGQKKLRWFAWTLNFESPLSCSEIQPCIDDAYPGEGDQFFYLTSFPGVDTCLIYEASRFFGVDTVCVMVCDELGVCDEFKIPFSIAGETLAISAGSPFFDDFSAYSGPYATPDLWLDRDVFVNNTLAKDPPSVGFATFDGLNRRGQPYPIDNSGVGDQLTSKAIDLSGFTVSDVLSLRYFVAPKGYGQEPEPNDTLKVEFLNDQGKWIEMDFLPGQDFNINETPPFEFRGVAIDDGQFLHDAFQFRFTARVSPGGYGDWWHVDYVYLGLVDAASNEFPDLAYTALPNNFLSPYSSMPFRHLKGFASEETTDLVESHYFNHFSDTRTLSSSSVNFLETTTNTPLGVTDFEIVAGGNENNILPDVPEVRTRSHPGMASFTSDIDGIPDDDFRNIQVEYAFVPSVVNALSSSNDTVRLNVPFSNYFAYDDGTAEQAYFIQTVQAGEQVAVKFHANVDDSIHAVQIMFPHFSIGNPLAQSFNLKIWKNTLDENGLVFERELLKPFFPDAVYDTLQGFTTYILDDLLGEKTPVSISAGDEFYVGWEYASIAPLSFVVGLDVQRDCDCAFADTQGDGFEPFPFSGSLMVRPVVESVPFNTSSGTADVAPTDFPFTLYPNPTSGMLNLELEHGQLEDYKLLVFNQLGQLVGQPATAATLDVGQFENGVYYLQVSDKKTGQHFIKRFLIAR